jgi:hypothetical protein
MKKLTLIFLVLVSALTIAQPPGDREPSEEQREKIKTLKIAFLSEKLSLTSEEATTFWPVYNDFDKKRHTIRKKERAFMKELKKSPNAITDANADQKINELLALRQQGIDLEKSYKSKFIEQLGAKRTLTLYLAEKQFHRELMKKIREEKGRPNRSEGGPR